MCGESREYAHIDGGKKTFLNDSFGYFLSNFELINVLVAFGLNL